MLENKKFPRDLSSPPVGRGWGAGWGRVGRWVGEGGPIGVVANVAEETRAKEDV